MLVQDFDYDFLGRLTSASTTWTPGVGGVYTASYGYDPTGNITLAIRDGVPEIYGYDPDHPHAVRRRGGAERYAYDDAGNMTYRLADDGIPYGLSWTPYGGLDGVTGLDGGVTFHWGPDGELVRKYDSWTGTSTLYAGPDYELDGTVRVKYYRFAGLRIAVKRAGELTYLAADHLGSTSVAIGATGQLVGHTRYLPFGGERYGQGPSVTDRLFTGERRHDDAGGLYHMGARFYDPEIGRWTAADTILPDVYSSQQLNRYSYTLNDPLNLVDPTGFLPEDEIETYFGISTKEEFAAIYGEAIAEQVYGTTLTWGDVLFFECGACEGGTASAMLLLKETSTDSELFKGTFWGISGTYEGTNHLGESFQFSLTGHEVWESILEHAEWAGVDVAATDSYRGRYENIPASGGYYGATWNDVAFWRPLSWLIGLGAPLEGYATLSKLYQAWGVVEEVTDDITDIGHPLGDYHRAYPVIRLPGQFGYIYKSTWSFVAPRAPQRW